MGLVIAFGLYALFRISEMHYVFGEACEVNVETMWLAETLFRDFHIIASFRRGSTASLRAVFRRFVAHVTAASKTGFDPRAMRRRRKNG